jgi:hypothetical protein
MDEEITLTMSDGSSEIIHLGPNEDVLDLYLRVLSEPDAPEAQLIARSVGVSEPGGSRMIELARAILNSPVEPEETEEKGALIQ